MHLSNNDTLCRPYASDSLRYYGYYYSTSTDDIVFVAKVYVVGTELATNAYSDPTLVESLQNAR